MTEQTSTLAEQALDSTERPTTPTEQRATPTEQPTDATEQRKDRPEQKLDWAEHHSKRTENPSNLGKVAQTGPKLEIRFRVAPIPRLSKRLLCPAVSKSLFDA